VSLVPVLVALGLVAISLYVFLYGRGDWRLHLILGLVSLGAGVLLYVSTIVHPTGMSCTVNYTSSGAEVTCSERYSVNPTSFIPFAICIALFILHIVVAVLTFIAGAATYLIEEAGAQW